MNGRVLKTGLLLLLFSPCLLAKTVTPPTPTTKITKTTTPDLSKIFQGKNGCFMLYNNNTKQLVEEYNPQQCQTRISPCSTFKIPLSLMAFDQKIITQNTVFKWDGIDKGLPQWNHDQTP